jgi:peptidoglycan/LPS O-acetylase OafA/YrhL
MNMTLRPIQLKNQYLFVDFLKTIAVQIIIFHHLCNYGIISLKVHELYPHFVDFVGLHGRYAVQIFLVIGGYLTAKSLPQTLEKFGLWKTIINRYLRLAPTYIVAILITMICAMIARVIHYEEYIGESETIAQLLAHFFFLQNILQFESISVGVWYVAIDWQLYIFTACLLFFMHSFKKVLFILPIVIVFSLMHFSQYPLFEDYFIYFIGAYGLGILAFLAEDTSHLETRQPARILLLLFFLLILSDTFFELRIKNVIEILLAVLLTLYGKRAYNSQNMKWSKICIWFSQRSYCAFLIHFSLLLLGNSIYYFFQWKSSITGLFMMLLIWFFSWISAHFLYNLVEFPSRKIQLK